MPKGRNPKTCLSPNCLLAIYPKPPLRYIYIHIFIYVCVILYICIYVHMYNVYVCTQDEIKEVFKQYGEIEEIFTMRIFIYAYTYTYTYVQIYVYI